jgi:hypothetical protein
VHVGMFFCGAWRPTLRCGSQKLVESECQARLSRWKRRGERGRAGRGGGAHGVFPFSLVITFFFSFRALFCCALLSLHPHASPCGQFSVCALLLALFNLMHCFGDSFSFVCLPSSLMSLLLVDPPLFCIQHYVSPPL